MPIALVGLREDNALYTSDSDIVLVMSLTDKRGTGSVSRGGMLNELCVKTEWKKLLKRLAFSLSELAIWESRQTVGGIA